MVEYEGKREYKEDRINIMHYNDKTGMYKTLSVNPTDKNDSAFFSIRQGVKGSQSDRLVLALGKQEIAYMVMELTKLYNELS